VQFLKCRSQSKTEPSQKLPEYFLRIWQQNSDVFNFTAKIKNQQEWEAFLQSCTLTEKDLDIRVANFVAGVKSGAIERRFIPASPDAFVLRGHLQRSADPFKKPGQHISNDNVDEDVSKYFREADDWPTTTGSEEIDF
jgi:hypothetical protein